MSKKLRRHNLEWSEFDTKRLRALAAEGVSSREAAKRLGRSTGAVKYKAMTEGVRFHAINQPTGVQRRLARKRRKFGIRATLRKAA